jgi:acyl-coenzyme A synthetase/AMP-(fatty) acid ligase
MKRVRVIVFKNIPSPSPFTTTITIQKVAKYKIPKYVELIEELPKTASGKIQKFL